MEKQLTNKSLVPVAYQVRMSDGRWGTIFHHPDKPLGEHRPLYAHPSQPSVSVAEAAVRALIECICDMEAAGINSPASAHAALAAMEASHDRT